MFFLIIMVHNGSNITICEALSMFHFSTLSIYNCCWVSLRIIDVRRLLCLYTIFTLVEWLIDWTGYLNELKISRNAKHAFIHHWIVCITYCVIANPSMSMISGAWKSTTSQTGVTTLQPTELVDDCCLHSSNQKYVSQIDISQLITHMEAILTDFRFYTNYANIHISEYFYLSLLFLYYRIQSIYW